MSDRAHVICGTCGRDNAARLTFCEDCGARLAARVAAPTPPVGLRVDNTPAQAAQRPSAPDFAFTKKEVTPRAPPSGPAPAGGSPSGGPSSSASPPPSSARPSAPAFMVAAPAPQAVQVSHTGTKTCPRCRGISEAGVAFCRFCGASIEDATGGTSPAPQNGDGSAAAKAKASGEAHRITKRSGPTQAAPVGRMLSIGQDGKPSAAFELVEHLDLGRSEGDVLVSWDPYVSPRHLRLEVRAGVVYARDLGSVNGTFLRLRQNTRENPPKLAAKSPSSEESSEGGLAHSERVTLQDQDLILLGQQVIRFEVVKDAEAGFGPATQHGTAVFGTPSGPVYARLCQRTVEGVTRDVFHVRKDEVVLGRELGDFVFTDDAFLSRRHAILRRNASADGGGTFTLADAGSSNGTFLRVRGEVRLQGGDEIRIGQQLFRIELPPAPPRAVS